MAKSKVMVNSSYLISDLNKLNWNLILWNIGYLNCFIDSPGHGRIGGHYFHKWCPYVRTSEKQ